MKFYALTDNLGDYTAVSFGKITLPLVIKKRKEVVGIAHGNGEKEVRETKLEGDIDDGEEEVEESDHDYDPENPIVVVSPGKFSDQYI